MSIENTQELMTLSGLIMRLPDGVGAIADVPYVARRLVACWNACEGSKVADLERLGADYIKPLIDLIDHKEAARTLLSDALEAFDDNPSQDHEVADRIREFLKVEA